MGTFHPFPRLPLELREQIWAEAIRPRQPGAHFFTIYNNGRQDEISEIGQHVVATSKKNIRPCSLAAPRCRGREFSWTSHNPSAYLTDRGLWTACWESRLMMGKHYDMEKWNERLAAEREECTHNTYPDAPATVSILSKGEQQYVTVFPQLDLFCLRPLNHNSIDWDDVFQGWCSRIPFFVRYWGYQANHIALEWDPSWDDDEAWDMADGAALWSHLSYPDTPLGCILRACEVELWGMENIWIIDPRIRRASSETPLRQDRKRWTLGDGCQLVEVWPIDEGWTGVETTDGFIDRLDEVLDKAYRSKDPWLSLEDYLPTNRFGPNIVALAYVDPDD
ncbi:hypothetical protein SCUP515_07485 [Seiridium cupressi]